MTATNFILDGLDWGGRPFFAAVFFGPLFGLLLAVSLIHFNIFRGGRETVITVGRTEGDSDERR